MNEKTYLADLIASHQNAKAQTGDKGWKMAHQQHIEALQKRLVEEIRKDGKR